MVGVNHNRRELDAGGDNLSLFWRLCVHFIENLQQDLVVDLKPLCQCLGMSICHGDSSSDLLHFDDVGAISV